MTEKNSIIDRQFLKVEQNWVAHDTELNFWGATCKTRGEAVDSLETFLFEHFFYLLCLNDKLPSRITEELEILRKRLGIEDTGSYVPPLLEKIKRLEEQLDAKDYTIKYLIEMQDREKSRINEEELKFEEKRELITNDIHMLQSIAGDNFSISNIDTPATTTECIKDPKIPWSYTEDAGC